MKVKIILLVVLSGLLSLSLAIMHPFHVGVLEIRAEDKTEEISLSVRLFMDDLQEAVYIHTGNKSGFGQSAERIEQDLNSYLTSHLKVKLNGEEVMLHFEGFEIEEEAVWSYYSISFKGLPKSLSVENDLLYDLFKDQAHFIHYYKNKERVSHKLVNPVKEVSF